MPSQKASDPLAIVVKCAIDIDIPPSAGSAIFRQNAIFYPVALHEEKWTEHNIRPIMLTYFSGKSTIVLSL